MGRAAAPSFRFYAFRFRCRALRVLSLPGWAANHLRGALGLKLREKCGHAVCEEPSSCPRRFDCDYATIFEPAPAGPSGLATPPRPFTIRAHWLNGKVLEAGEDWDFEATFFICDPDTTRRFVRAVREAVEEGLGLGRAPSRVTTIEALQADCRSSVVFEEHTELEPVTLSLAPRPVASRRFVVRLVTPADIRGWGPPAGTARFEILFSRIQDRLSTLSAAYGEGPLEVDFKGMRQRARDVRAVRQELIETSFTRRSARSGQVHLLRGATGEVEYEGEAGEFMPYLEAAWWTGVGRHASWGKGLIEVVAN